MNRKQSPRGIILLVVLASLTFFSVLVAAYLVFSNQSRQASYAISARNIHRPDVNGIIDDALMTLIRGTNDGTNPFYGEDLLSDYYGRSGGLDLTTGTVNAVDNGFVRFRVSGTGLSSTSLNDLYAGRIITFTSGDLNNRSFRVLRSFSSAPPDHDLVIDLGELPVPVANDTIRMNGIPGNSPGLGFNPTNFKSDETTATHTPIGGDNAFVGYPLPVALQPNHGPSIFDKSALVDATKSRDFNEPYVAADFNNWFLSYRHSDGSVIPSFHRPSVINYILNQKTNTSWSTPTPAEQKTLFASLSRATFRPLPIHTDFLTGGLNAQFTGGNANFALRVPMQIDTSAKLNQLALVLTGSTPNSWDVDNDGDGVPDSVWVDLGLPFITTPEGKLVRPLAAVMIEDLSGKLNVNAHHNVELTANLAGVQTRDAEWAGTRNAYGNAANDRTAYRGFGFGPAEIAIPIPQLANVIEERYKDSQTFSTFPRWSPGGAGNNDDPSDIILNGSRPPQHAYNVGYGLTTDPFGRGGMAIDRSGGLLVAAAGTTVRADDTTTTQLNERIDESINHPYEFDPTGRLSNDAAIKLSDLEGILRANFFDNENVSQKLTSPLASLANYSTLARQLTSMSISDTSPPPFEFQSAATTDPVSVYGSLAKWLTGKGVPVTAVESLIAPELRLGNRIDVNRPFGNGVDNSSPPNGVIDEPSEAETSAFAIANGSPSTIPAGYGAVAPDYNFNDSLSARQFLAKHLYVLMMAIADGKDFPVFDSMTVDVDKLKARRIAQWAVNVVDYRDADSIMTRFQYDPDPFDASGWTPTETVFGVEHPELVLSETLAFHDVRVRDTDLDDGPGKDTSDVTPPTDPDSDQVRLPQGSLFVELMCPRPAPNNPISSTDDHRTKAAFPMELYDDSSGTPKLNLSLTAPPVAGALGAPVWRLAISEPHYDEKPGEYAASGNEDNDPLKLQDSAYESVSFDPSNLDPLGTSGASLTLDRFVWFRSFATPAELTSVITSNGLGPEMTPENTFFANSSALLLEPGQFTVIAPRSLTYLGSQSPGGAQPEKPSDQRLISSASNGVIHYGLDNNAKMTAFTSSTKYTNALSILARTFRPTGWPATRFTDGFVGLNVSEPLPNGTSYYPQPTAANYLSADPTAFTVLDAYVDLSSAAKTAKDKSVDLDTASPRLPESLDPAVAGGKEVALGTIPSYCSLFLQRLADPLSPYNQTNNPYVTVDWMTVDLNVFSGEENPSKLVNTATYARRSRQKNGRIDGDLVNALHSYATNNISEPAPPPNSPDDPINVSVDESTAFYFAFPDDGSANRSFYSSLSFLNTAEANANPGFEGFTDSVGSEAGATGITGHDRNFPRIPYAKHSWLNRPFVSPYEMMLVPASSPGRLFHEFSVSKAAPVTNVYPDTGTPAAAAPPAVVITSANHGFQTGDTVKIEGVQRTPTIDGIYDITVIDANRFSLDMASTAIPSNYVTGSGHVVKFPALFAASTSRNELMNFYAPFAHLLNFAHTPASANDAINFSRLFDYVQTKPPFRGEIELLSPVRTVANNDIKDMYTPPFNYVLDNRRVGKVNLNTVENFETWKGLMLGHLNNSEATTSTGIPNQNQLSFQAFLDSRRGYALDETTSDVSATVVNYDATKFNSAFPTQFAGVFTEATAGTAFPDFGAPVLQRRTPEATLFRSRGTADLKSYGTGMSGDAPQQLVRGSGEFPQTQRWPQWQLPGINPTGGNFHRDRARNPALRYQTLMRMPNLVSDNSQTFVIRMTIGFFEVDANNTNSLGAEYGESTGDAQRYKAMFIIDRSIPVGFEPGRDLNARDTVVFERYYQ